MSDRPRLTVVSDSGVAGEGVLYLRKLGSMERARRIGRALALICAEAATLAEINSFDGVLSAAEALVEKAVQTPDTNDVWRRAEVEPQKPVLGLVQRDPDVLPWWEDEPP